MSLYRVERVWDVDPPALVPNHEGYIGDLLTELEVHGAAVASATFETGTRVTRVTVGLWLAADSGTEALNESRSTMIKALAKVGIQEGSLILVDVKGREKSRGIQQSPSLSRTDLHNAHHRLGHSARVPLGLGLWAANGDGVP